MFAVNPLSASRYRDRHSVSGAKSDPGDAKVLADLVRTDRHNHRQAAADSDLAEAVKALARAHQSMIWSRRRQANMLRSALREFYPAALAAFDDLTSGFEAPDEDAARQIMAADPAISSGYARGELRPFRVSLLRGRDCRPGDHPLLWAGDRMHRRPPGGSYPWCWCRNSSVRWLNSSTFW